jgi:sulfoxide reductase heme-binding subunit YedZ
MMAIASTRPLDYGWWLCSRASGIVALILISSSVILGLAMAGKAPQRPGIKRVLAARHEQLALAGLTSIAVHGITLLGDPWLHPGLAGVAIPFTMSYRPAFTGPGIVAGYLAALLGLSFYVRRHIGAALWRRLHRFTVLVYALAVVHVIGAGTDATKSWLQIGLAASAVVVVVQLALRHTVLSRTRRGRTRSA